jgi:hypothetical protein
MIRHIALSALFTIWLTGCETMTAIGPTKEENYKARMQMISCLQQGAIKLDDGISSSADVGRAVVSSCRNVIHSTAKTWGKGLSKGAMRQLIPKVNNVAAEMAVEAVLMHRANR